MPTWSLHHYRCAKPNHTISSVPRRCAFVKHFDTLIFLSKCDKWIKGYHLSDNDGESDSNQGISKDSWFWPNLKKNIDYYSLEIYDTPLSFLETQIQLTQSKLKL